MSANLVATLSTNLHNTCTSLSNQAVGVDCAHSLLILHFAKAWASLHEARTRQEQCFVLDSPYFRDKKSIHEGQE